MTKTLLLDSVAGVAGDMFTASFVDAGLVGVEDLNKLVAQMHLSGVRIESHAAMSASVTATRISVRAESDDWKSLFTAHVGSANLDHHHHHDYTNLAAAGGPHWHAHYRDIDRVIRDSALADPTKELARRIFFLLATAESEVHGLSLDKTAFHELGTIDSIMDVVMAAHCVVNAGASEILATPVKPGRGLIKIAHGDHRVPPPASSRLLIGMPIASTPTAIQLENVELSTPTGIAIIKALAPKFVAELPRGTLSAHGRGAGTKDLGNFPNVFQVSLVEYRAGYDLPYQTDSVCEIICNIDDDTAEHIAWMAEKLLEHGALDVWQTPALGKKGRAVMCLSVLAAGDDVLRLADWVLRNGTTFGVRYRQWNRLTLSRHFEEREENGSSVRFKIGSTLNGEKLKEKLEFEDWKKSH